jgi:opacity protein-like surface antigen
MGSSGQRKRIFTNFESMFLKKSYLIIILFVFVFYNGYSQLERTTSQVGISVLPIFDLLKFFPDNKIEGLATSVNLGYLTIKKLSVGINPYYAQVSNTYNTTISKANNKEKQAIKLYGLNTYLRYYFISKEKFLAYSSLSLGFGNVEETTTDLSSLTLVKNSHTNKSVLTFLGGLGVNYFVIKNLALELNLSYINVKYISTNPHNINFQTVAPTFGVQFYWK